MISNYFHIYMITHHPYLHYNFNKTNTCNYINRTLGQNDKRTKRPQKKKKKRTVLEECIRIKTAPILPNKENLPIS